MAIHKPAVSVTEARRLSQERSETTRTSDSPTSLLLTEEPTSDDSTPIKNNEPVEHVSRRQQHVVLLEPSQDHEPKVQVFLSAPLPAVGVSSSFDLLARQYHSTRALQMILRRALDEYEILLSRGTFPKNQRVYAAADPQVFASTSRMMPKRLLEIALAHFDPLGFESTRAIGRKLATAALAAFFEVESKREKRGSC